MATPAAATHDNLPAKPGILQAIMALCLVGIGVSIYLVRHKLHISLDPSYISSCNLGGAINCDKVNVSGWSELFGIPISLYGIPTYAVMFFLSIVAVRGCQSTDKTAREHGVAALNSVAGIGLLTSIMSLGLIWYSTAKIEAYCIYCISLYVVNFGITALAITAGPKTVAKAITGALDAASAMKEPLPISIGVLVIAGGVSWWAYDATKFRMEQEYKGLIEKQFAAGDAPAAAPDSAAPANAAPAAAASAKAPDAPAEAAKPAPVIDAKAGVPSGKKTEDGYTFYITPLDDQDYIEGNPNAKVTVVKYSDFECPYCKFLALQMKPLEEKYKDKVRFVMKHFPMNPICNKYMAGYDKHPNACNASITGICAGRQGKFWQMHDKLYAEQPKLSPEDNRGYAEGLGLDMAKYDACVKDPSVLQRMNSDIDLAIRAGINGAPRTYINGRMVTGSASTAILEYYIQKTLENPDSTGQAQAAVAEKIAPKPDGKNMIAAKTAKTSFFIDAYEGSLTPDGKALSKPDVEPAQVSWLEADGACKKAGKRLCTEEEWVSACAATPAIDENTNNQFADDNVEGNMYPYGSFYEVGNCVDQEDKYKGKAGKTGVKEKCRTASGIFDLAGNIGEWSGTTKETAGLMGGHNNSGERAACNQRSASFGVGNRNQTTGFRCCADSNIVADTAAQVAENKTVEVGKPVPAFKVKDHNGAEINSASFKGKVTLINFFASWCGPCKKEFPELVNLAKEHKAKGFQVISVGVDREGAKSVEFAKGFEAMWGIVQDEESELMGQFGVYSMPATFIVDRQGVVKFMDTGFKPEEQLEKLRSAIKGLL